MGQIISKGFKSPSILRACHALREKNLGWVNLEEDER